MKQSLILKLFLLAVFTTGNMWSQQRLTKVSQTFKVDKEVTIDLNTSQCNIVFDTWNKDVVEVEAFIEGEKLTKDELAKALKDWKVDIDATNKLVAISTKSNAPYAWAIKYDGRDEEAVNALLQELKFELADLPEMNLDFNFEMPEMPEMPAMPELPELPAGLSKIHFDYEAYKKNGEAYMEQWSKDFESNFGEDFSKKMEAWGEKFGKEWNEKYGKEMEKWGEKYGKEWEIKYGKQMEEWGEKFAQQIEANSNRMAEQNSRLKENKERQSKLHEERLAELEKRIAEKERLTDERRAKIEKMVQEGSDSKVIKTIKIKMPKDAKLKVNVRYGELKFASNIDNLKADLSHSKLIANSINGSNTSINASYSPIFVTYWNLGALNLNYVKNAQIDHAKSVMVTSNSSNITIKNLINNAIINGSIGDLKILKIDNAFNNLNVTLENSDALIMLPKVDFNLQYKGNKSRLSHPNNNKYNISSFSTGNLSSSKNIVINAKYSNIAMQ